MWDPAVVPGIALATAVPASLVALLMVVAVVVTVAGHLIQVRGVVVTGILLLFLATFGMLIGGLGASRDAPGPNGDPLRGSDRQLAPNETFGEARQRARGSQQP
jgi:hypothetical protein